MTAAPTPTPTTQPEADRKREATLAARLALAGGHVLQRLVSGEYVCTWRGQARFLRTLDEVEAHARRVGAIK